MAYVAETMGEAVYGTRALAAIAGLPPLVAIPYIPNSRDLAIRERWRKFYLASPILLIALAAIICNYFFMPLDILWVTVLQGVGLS